MNIENYKSLEKKLRSFISPTEGTPLLAPHHELLLFKPPPKKQHPRSICFPSYAGSLNSAVVVRSPKTEMVMLKKHSAGKHHIKDGRSLEIIFFKTHNGVNS